MKRILAGTCAVLSMLTLNGFAEEQLPDRMTTPADGAEMALVPAGAFHMGSNEGDEDERPAYVRDLPAFYIDVHEVTKGQYAKFLAATGRKPPVDWPFDSAQGKPSAQAPAGEADTPVASVTWYDAAAYAAWAGKRLPTEAEWEKAARGPDGRRFPWGNEWDAKRVNLGGGGKGHDVGKHPENASPCGAVDMIGNVWEWTSSWYAAYPGSSFVDPHCGEKFKIIRGGGAVEFYGVAPAIRCSDRYRLPAYGRFEGVGFRCVKDPGDKPALPDPELANESRWSQRVVPSFQPSSLAPSRAEGLPSNSSLAEPLALTVENPTNVARMNEIVTSGVPFPKGLIKSADVLRLYDDAGNQIPLQASATGAWPDGSVKWVLLNFMADVDPKHRRVYDLYWTKTEPPAKPEVAVKVEKTETGITVVTGPVKFVIDKDRAAAFFWAWRDANRDGEFDPDEVVVAEGFAPSFEALESVPKDPKATPIPPPETPAGRVKGLIDIKPTTTGWDVATGPLFEMKPLDLRALPHDRIEVEEAGPLRAVVRTEGWITAADGRKILRCVFRLSTVAGSGDVGICCTITNLGDTKVLWIKDASLTTYLQAGGGASDGMAAALFGGGASVQSTKISAISSEAGADRAGLTQGSECSYVFVDPLRGAVTHSGCRAPGWIDSCGTMILLRHFWQQFPKALSLQYDHPAGEVALPHVILHLWSGPALLDFDRTIAKTHEINLSLHGPEANPADIAERFEHPLFAVAPSAWYCATQAFYALSPFDYEANPTFETAIEAGLTEDNLMTVNGFKNYGDQLFPGGAKGQYSFRNMEYDIPLANLTQFVRTGLRKYLDAATIQCRHQADIDINHTTGRPWKHTTRHNGKLVDLGHVFLRGLVEHYHLTGERRSLEAAKEIGDWLVEAIHDRNEFNGGRDVGWPLNALTSIYEATGDEKYRKGLQWALDTLLTEANPLGCFEGDQSSITFFQGIQASGCIEAAEAIGHEKMKAFLPKLLDRFPGIPIEYGGRTLHALGWGLDRTGDPRYLDLAERTLERTLEHYRRLAAANIHFTRHYLPVRERYGVAKHPPDALKLSATQCALENGLYRRFVPAGRATLLLRDEDGDAFDLIAFVHHAKLPATLTVFDEGGRAIAERTIRPANEVTQRTTVAVPARTLGEGARTVRVELACDELEAWDVFTRRPMKTVWFVPTWKGLDRFPGRLYFFVQPGTSNLEFAIDSEGEQFHGITVNDPEGHPVGATVRFIDLPDKGRYRDELKVKVPKGADGALWSMELRDAKLVGVRGGKPREVANFDADDFQALPGEGIKPYAAVSPDAWFDPE